MAKDPRTDFHYSFVFEPFFEEDSFFCKKMFSGLAIYFMGKLVFVLMESGEEPWNGLLLPTEREFHASLLEDYPILKNHHVLGKWLYLSLKNESFEETAEKLVRRVLRHDERFGIWPKPKKTKLKCPRSSKKKLTKPKLKKSRPK